MPPVQWDKLFTFTVSPIELFIRGTITYISILLLLRLLRREPGGLGLADLLLLVLIADAAQNSMANEYKSVLDGLVLICTLVFWNYAFDWLALRGRRFDHFNHPRPIPLVRKGRMLEKNMRRQMITEEQLMSIVREHGVKELEEVEEAYLEGNGKVSIIAKDETKVA